MSKRKKKGLLPALRFPEFQKMNGWEEKPLAKFIEEFREKSTFQDEFEVLTSAREGLVRQRDYYDNDRITERDNVGFNIIPPNYLTYRSRSDDRRFYFNENELGITGIISTYYPVFRVVGGYNKFFVELLSRYSAVVGKHSVGTSQTVLSLNELRRIKLPIPTESEQRQISDCLSSIDKLTTTEVRKLDALKAHKKGLTRQLFPAEGKTIPKLRFPGFVNKRRWKKNKIGKITQVTAGATPNTSTPAYWNGDIPWMNSGELNLKRVRAVANRITEQGLKDSSTKLIPRGCVLIGLAGQGRTRGTAAINYIELCTNQSIASIHPNKNEFISEYLFQQMDSMYGYLRSLSEGEGGRGGLNLDIIKSIEIPLPSLPEQQKIADCLDSIDELIVAQKSKVDAMKSHKKGLVQQLFPTMDEVGE